MSERSAIKDAPFYVDKVTGEPCPTWANRLCTIEDLNHRHVAAHMLPPLNLTVTGDGDGGPRRRDILAAERRHDPRTIEPAKTGGESA